MLNYISLLCLPFHHVRKTDVVIDETKQLIYTDYTATQPKTLRCEYGQEVTAYEETISFQLGAYRHLCYRLVDHSDRRIRDHGDKHRAQGCLCFNRLRYGHSGQD